MIYQLLGFELTTGITKNKRNLINKFMANDFIFFFFNNLFLSTIRLITITPITRTAHRTIKFVVERELFLTNKMFATKKKCALKSSNN